jgi:hypothetical protein
MRSVLLTTLILGACTAESPCKEGFVADESGNCTRWTDTSPPEDTAVEHDMDFGPACEASTEVNPDPLSDLGVHDSITGQNGQENPELIEMVDIALDPERALAWGVGQGGLIGYTIQDPSAPERVYFNTQNTGDRFHHVLALPPSASGKSWVYATSRSNGLSVFDTTTPSSTVLQKHLPFSNLEGMAIVDSFLYITTRDGKLRTLNVADQGNPYFVHQSDGLGLPGAVLGNPMSLYIADQALGVAVMDKRIPDQPVFVESHAVGGSVQALALNDTFLVAAAGSAGIHIFSIEDPLHLTHLSSYSTGASIQDVALKGDLLWAVTQESVLVIDLSDPTNPRPLASRKTPYWAMAVDADSTTAWVADWGALRGYQLDESILAADIDPESSEILVNTLGEAWELTVTNRGADTLVIDAITTENPDLKLNYRGSLAIESLETLTVTLDWPGGDLDTSLCVRSNDPDESLVRITVQSSENDDSAIGNLAPDFTLNDIDGNAHTLSEQRGHPVVLIYFATW